MWENIFQVAVSYGIFSVLFCVLLIYQLRDSRKREAQYQAIIERLTKSLEEIGNGLDSVNRGIEGIFEVRGIVGELLDKVDEYKAKPKMRSGKANYKLQCKNYK